MITRKWGRPSETNSLGGFEIWWLSESDGAGERKEVLRSNSLCRAKWGVINSIDQSNFPMGKEDFLDNKIKKLTAFREFGEETGYNTKIVLSMSRFIIMRK